MLQKQLSKRNEKGFTIIEVLIVLAIAALILLIVFLAVPALQRNSRNNSRKNDASRMSTAIANWVSNNNGTLPGAEGGAFAIANFTTDCNSILSDVGTLSQFAGFTCATAAGNGTVVSKTISVQAAAGAIKSVGLGQNDGEYYVEQAVCPTATANTGTTLTLTGGNSRQSALVYTLETSSGDYNISCIQVT